jgi:FG-GAP-like repeat
MNTSRLLLGLGVAAAALPGGGVGNSRVDLMTTAGRLPAYRSVDYGIGHSREFGSVYVTDAIGSADFNGDGLPDVVYATANSGSASTFAIQFAVNLGKGRFVDGATSLFEGAVPRTQGGGRLVIADFNNDGRPDVYYADSGTEAAPNPPGYHDTLVLSTPDGKLVDATANIPQFHDFTHSATAADVNGDGSVDLYVGNLGGGSLCCSPMIWLNDGSGHFRVSPDALPESVTNGWHAYTASAFVDVNGDGHPDLVLGGGHDCPASPNPSEVLLNDGSGRFHALPGALPGKSLGRSTETLDIQPVDLNRDGHVDLVVASTSAPVPLVDCYAQGYVGRIVQILIGNGDGTFRDETATRLPQDTHLQSLDYVKNLTIADLNGDGAPDILTETVVPPGGDAVNDRVYLNDGTGHFRPLPNGYPFSFWHAHALVGDREAGRDIFLVQPSSGYDVWSVRRQRGKPLPPGSPAETRVSTDPATGQRVVAWPYVWGATLYQVWRSGTRIGITRQTRFVDTTGVVGSSQVYTVRAANSQGRSAFGPSARS